MTDEQQVSLFPSLQAAMPKSFEALSIVGASASGKAAARLAHLTGVPRILISDNNPNAQVEEDSLRHAVVLERGEQVKLLEHAETVVLSPGIPPHSGLVHSLQAKGFTLISEPDWATLNQPAHVAPWVSITGTNGKSTITSLIAHLLNTIRLPLHAVACGNIGHAVSDVISQAIQAGPNTRVQPVVELSSYQLHYSQHLKHSVGVFSNLTPDHLEWHGGLKHYEDAKARLFLGEQASHWAVLNVDDPVGLHMAHQRDAQRTLCVHTRLHPLEHIDLPQLFVNEKGILHLHVPEGISTFTPLQRLNVLQVKRSVYPFKGGHHTQNMLLALGAVLMVALEEQALEQALSAMRLSTAFGSFHGLEHRFERVALDEPHTQRIIVNDSKATNPESCIVAMESFKAQPNLLLLVGGLAKKTPLDAWAETAKATAQDVFAYGRDAHDFVHALERHHYSGRIHRHVTLESAVEAALALQDAAPERPLLFSPACASFDAFTNFEARGKAFKKHVHHHFTPVSSTSSTP
jgi:UDP-N-acetylmuramoylalanine--D-glutamate ligase